MSQVVQAACPGCKAVLRIPADYVGQPIRCKGCGTVLQTKAPAAKAPAAPPPTTPAPKRKVAPPPPPAPASAPPRIQQARPEAPPAAPLAAPRNKKAPDVASPFAFDPDMDDEPEVPDEPRRGKSKKKKKSGSWLGVIAAGVILATTAGAGLGVYTFVIKPRQEAAANPVEDPDNPDSKPTKGGKKGGLAVIDDKPVTFPRRAMVISVHNYLYANPLLESGQGTPNNDRLVSSISRALRVPLTQIIHLSDNAKKDPRPPLKSVIETGLSNFLKTSRKQDRVMVVFVGHTKEIENEGYLVPLDGEMDAPPTLIPLKWVYEQLNKCPARQKVLVIDGNRFNSSHGEERPAAGPMSEAFEKALKSPPAGVQVWSACSNGQQSQEFEESSLGLFLDSVRVALTPETGQKGALDGKIQKPDDLFPLETIQATVADLMAKEIERRKGAKQVAFLAGKPPADGAEFDRTEGPAQLPALPTVHPGDLTLVKAIMSDISLPPLKGGEFTSQDVSFSMLPPFPEGVMKQYLGGDLPPDHKLRKAIHDARVNLWAISTSKPPQEIEADVKTARGRLRVDLSVMRGSYSKPGGGAAETAFKNNVFEDARRMAPIVARLESVLEQLREAGSEKEMAPKRWQANYDFMLARFQASLAYLEEYSNLLGQMRKDLPEHDPNVHSGFRMASTEKASDAVGKKLERNARKLYGDLASSNPKTPWEVLAKREKLTALGLVWKAY